MYAEINEYDTFTIYIFVLISYRVPTAYSIKKSLAMLFKRIFIKVV